MEPFITTFTGKKVNPLNLKVEDISILDIAHHLATQNRFVGALPKPVNIAHHSYYVWMLVTGSGWDGEALFHDSPEAYLGDVSKWVKQDPRFSFYREVEDNAWRVICKALDLNDYGSHSSVIKEADNLMVRYEAHATGNNSHMFELESHPRPTKEEISRVGPWHPWGWEESEKNFLAVASQLGFTLS